MENENTERIAYNITNGLGEKVGEVMMPFRDIQIDTLLKTIANLKYQLEEKDLKIEKIKEYLKCLD